jgi:hypothetical protein
LKKALHATPKRLQRMLLQLQKYDIRLQYTPVKEMYIADTLSRAYLKDLPNDNESDFGNFSSPNITESSSFSIWAYLVSVSASSAPTGVRNRLIFLHDCSTEPSFGSMFHQYTYGRTVQVMSDHKPLESILKKPLHAAPKRLQRMLLQLQKYDIRLQYTPGKEMYIADKISITEIRYNKI